MSSVPDSAIAEKPKWTRAAMIVVRLALLVFLVWALASARFPAETPIAEDIPSPNINSRTVAEPCATLVQQLG